MIARPQLLARIRAALKRSRIVALVGPRQSGKTTMARHLLSPRSAHYFDLEDPLSLARLAEPMTGLASLRGLVVIDEVQRRPDLFPILRVLSDRKPLPARFLILGSASPALLQQSSESLAGRLEMLELEGFSMAEVGPEAQNRLWRRGAFPLSFLARSERDSFSWRQNFIRTYLERDLPQLNIRVPAATMLRFWTMLAHYHGNTWNAAEPARSLGLSQPTVRHYLGLMSDLFIARQIQPWHENLKKRQVKSPKVYFRDSGLLHQLLGIRTEAELLSHPKSGASWEGFAVEETLRAAQPDEAYFWATHTGAELDLLLFKGNRRIGVEMKRQDAPRLTPSIRIALEDLRLDHVVVIYPGDQIYSLAPKVRVVPLRALADAGSQVILSPRTPRLPERLRPAGRRR